MKNIRDHMNAVNVEDIHQEGTKQIKDQGASASSLCDILLTAD